MYDVKDRPAYKVQIFGPPQLRCPATEPTCVNKYYVIAAVLICNTAAFPYPGTTGLVQKQSSEGISANHRGVRSMKNEWALNLGRKPVIRCAAIRCLGGGAHLGRSHIQYVFLPGSGRSILFLQSWTLLLRRRLFFGVSSAISVEAGDAVKG